MPGINGHEPKAYFSSDWRNWEAVSGYFSDAWRTASDVYVKDGGTWKQVWVRLTAPTNGSSSISHVTATISWTAGVGQEGFKLYRNGAFVKNVAANATSTTDVVPAMQTNYTYTVSAYAGSTETAQIPCGTVSAEVPSITAFANLQRNWQYLNDTWNGDSFLYRHSASVAANATGYEYSLDGGSTYTSVTTSDNITRALSPNVTENVIWRAYITYNSVTYRGSWSNTKTIYSGLPQVRTARNDDVYFDAWLDKEIYYYIAAPWPENGFTTLYGFTTILVDSYQFRNLSASSLPASQITSSTRSITISKPGTNIVLSGTPYVSNGWDSEEFAWTGDATFRVNPSGTGWYNYSDSRKLTGYVRFATRYISQTAVTYTIS